jgi:hypothetical protein
MLFLLGLNLSSLKLVLSLVYSLVGYLGFFSYKLLGFKLSFFSLELISLSSLKLTSKLKLGLALAYLLPRILNLLLGSL